MSLWTLSLPAEAEKVTEEACAESPPLGCSVQAKASLAGGQEAAPSADGTVQSFHLVI